MFLYSSAFLLVGASLIAFASGCGVLSRRELEAIKERHLQNTDWGYSQDGADWDELFEGCAGNAQTPIDLPTLRDLARGRSLGAGEYLPALAVSSATINGAEVLNNGKTIQVNVPAGTSISGAGTLANLIGRSTHTDNTYQLAQFHWHWGPTSTTGSEHTLGSCHGPLEIHFVHFNTRYGDLASAAGESDGLLVIGAIYDVGDENSGIAKILNDVNNPSPLDVDDSRTMSAGFSVRELLGSLDTSSYYLYPGSLTTPTCLETVTWVVLQGRLTLSEAQLNQFRAVAGYDGNPLTSNYRVVQPLNGRSVMSAATQTVYSENQNEDSASSSDDNVEGLVVATLAVSCVALVAVLIVAFFVFTRKRNEEKSFSAAGTV